MKSRPMGGCAVTQNDIPVNATSQRCDGASEKRANNPIQATKASAVQESDPAPSTPCQAGRAGAGLNVMATPFMQ